jgi:integrase/recombinase XerD
MAFARAVRKSKVCKGDFHALRKTFGRQFILAGGDIFRLSKILGHSSVEVTRKHYAHLVPDDLKAPMDAAGVEDLLKTLPAATDDEGPQPA